MEKTIFRLLSIHDLFGICILVFIETSVFAQTSNLKSTLVSTNSLPPPGFATHMDYLKSFTNEDDAMQAYRNGAITKSESTAAHFLIGNLKGQNFFGKVIDQNSSPVPDADVSGYLRSDEGMGTYDEKVEEFKTRTDSEGLFQFTELHGARFGEKVSKSGYEMNSGGYIKPIGLKTSANDRATFIMYKLRGAEPMVHKEFESRVPYNGTGTLFDLVAGKKTAGGNLKVVLSRSPLKIRRGWDKYDWNLKIETINGGLIAESDAYPNWAPGKGYKSSFETTMSSNAVPWVGEFKQDFYVKNKEGSYGHMLIDLSTDSMRPDTGITIQTWFNPSGSQNLEFDPKKQIR
jgi:hypothetical protein